MISVCIDKYFNKIIPKFYILKVITAVQMVIEEKYVGQQDIPALQAIGWEG